MLMAKQPFKADTASKIESSQKNGRIAKGLGIIAGAIVAVIASVKGIRIMNKPSKQVIEILETKLLKINEVVDQAKEVFTTQLKTANSELSAVFSKPTDSAKETFDFAAQIQKANNPEGLINQEESCFNELFTWFDKKLDDGKKAPEELLTKYNEIAEKLKLKLNTSSENALGQVNTHSDIPKNIQNKRKTKKILESFNFQVKEAKRTIQETKDFKMDDLKEGGKSLFREYNNYSSRTVATKNEQSKNLLSLVQQKLEGFISSSLPTSKSLNNSVKMNIIPADVPSNILENKFYQFASNTSEKDFEASIPAFTDSMGEKLSHKDIQILIKRLELRQKVSNDINSSGWYGNKIKQLNDCESKVSAYLENSFYNSGKNIDVYNLSLEQEDSIIFSLQQHSKKLGFSTVSEMIHHFSMGDISNAGELSKDLETRMERYTQSSLSKIYPKIKDKFDDFDRLVSKKNS